MARGFRIAELSRRAETPKETIHYYLRIGLLRKPRKTSKNMAYYDDGHVEQLKLIRRLRAESYLPLSVIKKVLKEGKLAESTRKIDLAGDLFGQGAKAEFEPLNRSALAEKLSITEEQVEAFVQSGLLLPRENGTFGWEDIRVAELLIQAESEAGEDAEGFVLERFQILERHITELVREESAHFFASLLATSSSGRALNLLRGGRDTVGRYLAIARVRRLRFEIEALLREVEGAIQDTDQALEARVLPRTPEARSWVESLVDAHEAHPNQVKPARALFTALIQQGGEMEIVDRYEGLRRRPKADPEIQKIVVEALLDFGRFSEAVSMLESLRPRAEAPDQVLDLLFAFGILGRLRLRIIAVASNADRDGTDSFEVIGDLVTGLSHLHRTRAAEYEGAPHERLRYRLTLGRLETAMPPFLGRGGSGRQELRGELADAEALEGTDQDPGLGITRRIRWQAAQALAFRSRRADERAAMVEVVETLESEV